MQRFSRLLPTSGILSDLRSAGFPEAEILAVRRTHAMWQQLIRFYRRGGKIERVNAHFSGANGAPDVIRFYCSSAAANFAHSNFDTLAHELGHALFYPEQWMRIDSFLSADAYARSRELGEAYAWLNQYRLSQEKVGATSETSYMVEVENENDFGRQIVDIFARIAEREASKWSDTQILDELAQLNANMFPCGMREGNSKTYGQCNRWDYLLATREHQPVFDRFLCELKQAPEPNLQKVLIKRNLFAQVSNRSNNSLSLQAFNPLMQQKLAHLLLQSDAHSLDELDRLITHQQRSSTDS